jgi:hypothetical protein
MSPELMRASLATEFRKSLDSALVTEVRGPPPPPPRPKRTNSSEKGPNAPGSLALMLADKSEMTEPFFNANLKVE